MRVAKVQEMPSCALGVLLLDRGRDTTVRGTPSRPGELHPEPLTDPDVNLSIHPARATRGKLPPSGETVGSSGCPLTQSRRG
jgi:hypothetical protein